MPRLSSCCAQSACLLFPLMKSLFQTGSWGAHPANSLDTLPYVWPSASVLARIQSIWNLWCARYCTLHVGARPGGGRSTIVVAFDNTGFEGLFMYYSDLYFTFVMSWCLSHGEFMLSKKTSPTGEQKQRQSSLNDHFSKVYGEGGE